MNFGPGTYRSLMIAAAWIFGVFLVVAFVWRRADADQDTLGIVAGVAAYLFLAVAAVILVRGWRRRGADALGAAARYVDGHPEILRAVGRPMAIGEPEGEVPGGEGAAQANLVVPVQGPAEEGAVELVMARISRDWEVLSATLVIDGDRVRLSEGRAGSPVDDD
ncbi:cytochrome c oxidase assembly factor Coa1 family protein [Miltoncostaea marina]|uniref:cytochrome c oxidase assembly factor Coa1 family protein n=1 Tax=Miltoncostaea marina TaxID=2843215 RepID=UPI001C3E597D|nr:cytochrome c oxidase assembly factor Coa1 family protein [Miltoncostaea marina]